MSFRISIRLNDDLYKKIQKLSDVLSDSLSDVCRTAIEQYILENEQEKTGKKQTKNSQTFNYNYINQLEGELSYLKNENIMLREQIDKNIFNISSQLDMRLDDPFLQLISAVAHEVASASEAITESLHRRAMDGIGRRVIQQAKQIRRRRDEPNYQSDIINGFHTQR